MRPVSSVPPLTSAGKFIRIDGSRFLVKGVSYGTFVPDADGSQFPPPDRVATDFAMMAQFGINTVRLYTPPPSHCSTRRPTTASVS